MDKFVIAIYDRCDDLLIQEIIISETSNIFDIFRETNYFKNEINVLNNDMIKYKNNQYLLHSTEDTLRNFSNINSVGDLEYFDIVLNLIKINE